MGNLYIPPEVHRFANGMSAFDGPVDRVQDPLPSYSVCREMAEEEVRNDLEDGFAPWLQSCSMERTFAEGFYGLISTPELMKIAANPKAPVETAGLAIRAVFARYLEDNRSAINKRAEELEAQS